MWGRSHFSSSWCQHLLRPPYFRQTFFQVHLTLEIQSNLTFSKYDPLILLNSPSKLSWIEDIFG